MGFARFVLGRQAGGKRWTGHGRVGRPRPTGVTGTREGKPLGSRSVQWTVVSDKEGCSIGAWWANPVRWLFTRKFATLIETPLQEGLVGFGGLFWGGRPMGRWEEVDRAR